MSWNLLIWPTPLGSRWHGLALEVLPPMRPRRADVTIHNNSAQIAELMDELIVRPRRDLAKWAGVTKQTANIKIGYSGQHLASLITGVEGTRTGARGHDLRDGSEVKSCSRVDQLDRCRDCSAAVARLEASCPECQSTNIHRKKDSKWLLAVRSEEEFTTLVEDVPRVVFLLVDYPYFDDMDWSTLQFQAFEIWPQNNRHRHFRTLMRTYFDNIYLPHIERNPRRTPAPKNFWPYSFQFYMCNPVRTFHCIVENALGDPNIRVLEYVEPLVDRADVDPIPMPLSVLRENEREFLRAANEHQYVTVAQRQQLTEHQRAPLELRDTDRAMPQTRSYRRGDR